MKHVAVRSGAYYDSVFLMRLSREAGAVPGVASASVVMGTPANVEALVRAGFAATDLTAVGPNDLVVAVDAADEEAIVAARQRVEDLLSGRHVGKKVGERPRTLAAALQCLPEANLALISVPGAYAARAARHALRRGLHVMLFSDNVAVEDEIVLKEEARRRGLLMMGPDCGTAILGGMPLGFANAVRRGPIGIVGASGTGIQEVASLVHRWGGGISQAIGTGGRDLSPRVGGRMTIQGIEALASDDATEVIVIVSKSPAPDVAEAVTRALSASGKPSVVRFVGLQVSDGVRPTRSRSVVFAGSLAEAAFLACRAAGVKVGAGWRVGDREIAAMAKQEAVGIGPGQRWVRGLFCGGTLAQEAWAVLAAGGVEARSNVALTDAYKIEGDASPDSHSIVDLGDDVFTRGRPHPMMDPALRDERVIVAAGDPGAAVILVDLVLGFGSHPDPAVGLAAAVQEAGEAASRQGRALSVVASITGTDRDPQGWARQHESLTAAGVRVVETGYDAARLACAIVTKLELRGS